MSKSPIFSLIFLHYDKPSLLRSQLAQYADRLAHHEHVEAIWVDNGSTDPIVGQTLTAASARHGEKFKTVHIPHNIGFGRGMNRGAEYATGDVLIFISSDVMFEDFITTHAEVIERLCTMEGALVGQTLYTESTGWNKFGNIIIPYVAGHWLAVARRNFMKFDERYYPYDYEDVDLSWAHIEGGFNLVHKLVEIPDLPIRHLGGATIGQLNPMRHEHTVEMRKVFAKKWGLFNFPERP
jgi:GT2 family glycosyltransferase